jgi:beta-glucosidase
MVGDRSDRQSFPPGFTWGVATAASQIEGALGDARQGESIVERFCATSDRFEAGESSATACDHCHRFHEDIELMRRLGVGAYRFSIAWPRVIPSGKGALDAQGLAFYDRLLDALLDARIEPFVTLYHDDLPQPLEDRGGWPNRDTAHYFSDYTAVCAERFAGRVKRWITIDDPARAAFGGYFRGTHAPGARNFERAWAALHHLLLGHAEALAVLRDVGGGANTCGISVDLRPVCAASRAADEKVRDVADAFTNRVVLDPIIRGSYPAALREAFKASMPAPKPGDLQRIGAPIDFVGINYFTRYRAAAAARRTLAPFEDEPARSGGTLTGWEVYPAGLKEMALRVASEYGVKSIFVTANGAAFEDTKDESGDFHDAQRIDYLERHLRELAAAIGEGAPVKGYFVWSLLDGFEVPFGYRAPFGLVAVDRKNGFRRKPKASFKFYAGVIEQNAIR